MTDAFGQELRRLRATRIALRIGLVPLPFAVALVFFVADVAARLAWPEEAMIGITLALVSPFGLWWAPTLLELMNLACPRCTTPFFARPERVLAALFTHRARCAECGLSLHAKHPAAGWRDAAPALRDVAPEPRKALQPPDEADSAGSSAARR